MVKTQLIHIEHNKPFTDSMVIADAVNLKHAHVIKLVRKYEEQFQILGTLSFQNQKSGGRETEYVNLNEDQATFLITLFRNTAIVLEFKIKLVTAFRKALNELERLKNQTSEGNYNYGMLNKINMVEMKIFSFCYFFPQTLPI